MSLIPLSSELERLQTENDRLEKEVARTEEELHIQCFVSEAAAERSRQLEVGLIAARSQQDVLTQDNDRLCLKVRLLTRKMDHSKKGLKRVLVTLRGQQ